MKWQVLFYEKANGVSPVKDFLKTLPPGHQAKALREIDLLEQFGTALQRLHAAAVRQGRYTGLWELRIQFSGDASRIFYFLAQGNRFVLLHGFVKKTDALPSRELETARKRMEDHLRRCGE
jgi:phage-related protein